jgi:hypothetical protein
VREEPELTVSGPAGDQELGTPSAPDPEAAPEPESVTPAAPESATVPDPASEPAAVDAVPEPPALLRLRRAPRYRPFGFTGAGLGVLAGVVLALSFSATSDYSIRTIIGYFAAILGMIGAVAGLGVAVLLERRRGQ